MTVLGALGDAPTAAIAVVAILLGLLFAARGPRDKRGVDGGDAEERAPMMVGSLPMAAAPDTEPGFVGPEGTVVGHGPIRLGVSGPLGGSSAPQPAAAALPEPAAAAPPEPAAVAPPEPEVRPEPAPTSEPQPAEPAPQPESEPDPAIPPTSAFDWGAPAPPALTEPAAAEPAFFASPPTIPEPLAGAVPLPDAAPSPQAPSAPAPETEAPAPAEEAPSEQRGPAWRVAARAANSAVHFRQGTIKLGGKSVDKDQDR